MKTYYIEIELSPGYGPVDNGIYKVQAKNLKEAKDLINGYYGDVLNSQLIIVDEKEALEDCNTFGISLMELPEHLDFMN